MRRQVVARSYAHGWSKTTQFLEEKLSEGYIVVRITPFIKDGNTQILEYILEKEIDW